VEEDSLRPCGVFGTLRQDRSTVGLRLDPFDDVAVIAHSLSIVDPLSVFRTPRGEEPAHA